MDALFTVHSDTDTIFWNKQILQHLLDGIQFALGDLKADATPSASKIVNLPLPYLQKALLLRAP